MSLDTAPEEESSGFDIPSAELDVGPYWPAWKVTLVVALALGAFWTSVGYLALKMLGG